VTVINLCLSTMANEPSHYEAALISGRKSPLRLAFSYVLDWIIIMSVQLPPVKNPDLLLILGIKCRRRCWWFLV
jgi:hypothetical protein